MKQEGGRLKLGGGGKKEERKIKDKGEGDQGRGSKIDRWREGSDGEQNISWME